MPNKREDTFVKIPCDYRLEMISYENQLPTGNTLPVDGTPFDLRHWRSLADLDIDDIYWPKTAEPAGVEFRDEGHSASRFNAPTT